MLFLFVILTHLSLYVIFQAVRSYCYDEDPVLSSCGISIEKQLTHVDGRILEPPKVVVFVHFFPSLFFFFSWDFGGGRGGSRLRFLVGSRQYNVCPCNSQLKVGNSEDCIPRNGRWNFNNKVLF